MNVLSQNRRAALHLGLISVLAPSSIPVSVLSQDTSRTPVRVVASASVEGKEVSKTSSDSAHRRKFRIIWVYDVATQEYLRGARVLDSITMLTMETSETGHAPLVSPEFVRPDTNRIVITKEGYEPYGPVFVDPDPEKSPFVLIPMRRTGGDTSERAVMLPAVTTTEKYRLDRDEGKRETFVSRCNTGIPSCLGPVTFEGSPSKSLSDFLRDPRLGLTVLCKNGQSGRTRSSANRGSGSKGTCTAEMHASTGGKCQAPILRNGSFHKPAVDKSALDDLSGMISSGDIEGIEVYQSVGRRPLPFHVNPFCGVIVVWEKQAK